MRNPHLDVLVGTDFSECSHRAALAGAAYARTLGVSLRLAHVTSWYESRDTTIALLAEESTVLGLPVTATVLLSGSAAEELSRYARREPIGLIVVGTHGRRGWRRALLGSVSERLQRTAPCPVLVVPPPSALGVTAAIDTGAPTDHCLACFAPTVPGERFCDPCRARIRGEAISGRQREAHP